MHVFRKELRSTLFFIRGEVMETFYTPNTYLNNKFGEIMLNGKYKEKIEKKGYTSEASITVYKPDETFFKWDEYSPFDKLVHDACCSLVESGQREFSRTEIWRMITGCYDYSENPSDDILSLIDASLWKLMTTAVVIKGHISGKSFEYKGALIGCSTYVEKYHGQITYDVVSVGNIPPLLNYAKLKKQIVTYPTLLLTLGNKNTALNTTIKHYILKQIEIFKNKKNYRSNPTILLETLFNECEIITKKQKYACRKSIVSLLNDLIKEKYIRGYDLDIKNRSIRAIKIELTNEEESK